MLAPWTPNLTLITPSSKTLRGAEGAIASSVEALVICSNVFCFLSAVVEVLHSGTGIVVARIHRVSNKRLGVFYLNEIRFHTHNSIKFAAIMKHLHPCDETVTSGVRHT